MSVLVCSDALRGQVKGAEGEPGGGDQIMKGSECYAKGWHLAYVEPRP